MRLGVWGKEYSGEKCRESILANLLQEVSTISQVLADFLCLNELCTDASKKTAICLRIDNVVLPLSVNRIIYGVFWETAVGTAQNNTINGVLFSRVFALIRISTGIKLTLRIFSFMSDIKIISLHKFSSC